MSAPTATMTEPRRASAFDAALSGLIVAMIALAAGAVWAMLALWFGRTFAPLALALGALVGFAVRSAGFGGTWRGALGAGAVTLVACSYAQALIASTMVALAMGFNLLDTLLRIGTEMAFAVAWARATTMDLAIFVVAAGIAAGIAGRR